MALNCKKPCPVECDIVMKHRTSVSLNAKLTIDFLKLLMYQKGQIPVPYQQLKTYISSVAQETVKYEEEKSNIIKLRPKERFALAQLNRKRLRFLKVAEKFENDFNSLAEAVDSAFDSNCQQVAIIFGTSVFNSKEIIVLDWKNINISLDNKSDNLEATRSAKANQALLFRYLITSEDLAPFLAPVRPSSVHILCQTMQPPTGALPRLNFKFPLRTHRVTLRILLNDPMTTPEMVNALTSGMNQPLISTGIQRPVIRRLLFDSPLPINQQRLSKVLEDCDISGVASLDDDEQDEGKNYFYSNSEEPADETLTQLCWFQLKSSLQGFADESLFS